MPYLSLDLEMSGPDPHWNEVIQIGAVLYDDNWQELGTFLSNVYPENEEAFSSHSEAVHGLTLDELNDAPMMHEVLPDFEKWARKILGRKQPSFEGEKLNNLQDVLVCGQGVLHDVNFLQVAYEDQHLKWPFAFRIVDLQTISLVTFRILKNNGKNVPSKYNLQSVAQYFGYEREDSLHNALEDAQLAGKCLKDCFEILDDCKIDT